MQDAKKSTLTNKKSSKKHKKNKKYKTKLSYSSSTETDNEGSRLNNIYRLSSNQLGVDFFRYKSNPCGEYYN
jgi:hypothetical protein